MKNENIPVNLLKVLSSNLTIIHQDLDLNQKEFAAHIGVSPSHLCEILRSKVCVSLPLLETISDKTGVPAKQLLDEDYPKYFIKGMCKRNSSAPKSL